MKGDEGGEGMKNIKKGTQDRDKYDLMEKALPKPLPKSFFFFHHLK